MALIGPIGFTTPWLLWALAVLPVLWWLLRAVPPAPLRRRFPGVALLVGLEDRDAEADRTPWWLMALRMLALAAMILGFAGPVLNPEARVPGAGPLVIFIDDGWTAAPDWEARIEAADAALATAGQSGRPVAVVAASDLPAGLPLQAAAVWAGRLAAMQPVPWEPTYDAALAWAAEIGAAEVLWLSDGLDRPGRSGLLAAFEAVGPVRVLEPPAARLALRPPVFADGLVTITALRSRAAAEEVVLVTGHGPDPSGVERELARVALDFAAGALEANAQLSLPPELRNRIARFRIEGVRSAGAVVLADDTLRRRRVALIGSEARTEGLELLSPLHYLRQALEPTADLIEGRLADLLVAGPDVMILADVARLAEPDQRALAEWVAGGGLLLRFAGPRLAASDEGRGFEDVLLPVRLRAGGRTVGGAMSWGSPRALSPFTDTSPFYGLAIPTEVTVTSQVLAEPGPDLAARTIAALADGTPLVTRKALGEGQVVLFHVSANAEWSNLPLSGLFVQMLERLAVSTRPARPLAAELAGTTWTAERLLDAFGELASAGARPGIAGERLAGASGPDLPPGLYADGDRRLAVNAMTQESTLTPVTWPARIVPEWGGARAERDLSGWLFLLALVALAADTLAAMALSGRLGGMRRVAAAVLLLLPLPQSGEAQEADAELIAAAGEVTLAHVLTGDARLDAVAQAGLLGLSHELFRRSTVEPAPPVGVDPERDELSVYPLLYWPVTPDQPRPSPQAYARLNQYLAAGGMILFDTRDADVAGYGSSATPAAAALRNLALPLDIPPLELVPADHVLTRTFYLLSDFPGRYAGREVWIEAAAADAELAEGMPFRNLNDGVSPVVIGGNDWAAAWAVDAAGTPLYPVGRGLAGERQREMAYRFGVNLVMHVLTGNYKSDQVHVPALLERLGQ